MVETEAAFACCEGPMEQRNLHPSCFDIRRVPMLTIADMQKQTLLWSGLYHVKQIKHDIQESNYEYCFPTKRTGNRALFLLAGKVQLLNRRMEADNSAAKLDVFILLLILTDYCTSLARWQTFSFVKDYGRPVHPDRFINLPFCNFREEKTTWIC